MLNNTLHYVLIVDLEFERGQSKGSSVLLNLWAILGVYFRVLLVIPLSLESIQSIPSITSKSVISNLTRLTEVTFCDIVTGKFLYTHLCMIELPTRVEIAKGSTTILGLMPKYTAT